MTMICIENYLHALRPSDFLSSRGIWSYWFAWWFLDSKFRLVSQEVPVQITALSSTDEPVELWILMEIWLHVTESTSFLLMLACWFWSGACSILAHFGNWLPNPESLRIGFANYSTLSCDWVRDLASFLLPFWERVHRVWHQYNSLVGLIDGNSDSATSVHVLTKVSSIPARNVRTVSRTWPAFSQMEWCHCAASFLEAFGMPGTAEWRESLIGWTFFKLSLFMMVGATLISNYTQSVPKEKSQSVQRANLSTPSYPASVSILSKL